MKAFLIFLGLAAACGAERASKLNLKFGMSLFPWQIGQDNYIPYDMNKTEAIGKGYKLTPGPKIPLPELVLYCPKEDDKTICLWMDDETGDISGLNIAIRKDELSEAPFDWTVQGWSDWDVQTKDGNTVAYITIQLFFVSPEFCKKPVEERIASRKENKLTPEDAVWVTTFNQKLDRISISANDLKNSNFTKQAFFPMMGEHWYYKMTPTTECKEDTINPWFVLAYQGKVIGFGLTIWAKMPNNKYFEEPGQAAVKMIVPHGPDCLYEKAVDGGIRTLHCYLVDKPYSILLP